MAKLYFRYGSMNCGKSTAIRHITGIYKQTSGEVFVNNEPIWENTAVKQKISYIPDDIFYFG